MDVKKLEQFVSNIYGDLFTSYSKKLFDESVELFHKRHKMWGKDLNWFKDKVCLDAGCGGGRYVVALAQLGAKKVYGIDVSERAVEAAKQRCKERGLANTDIQVGSVLNLPFPDNTFDFVVSTGVIHHSADPYKAFRELTRVLKPGGKMFLSVYGKGGLMWLMNDFFRNTVCKIISFRVMEKLMMFTGVPANKRYNMLDNLYVPNYFRFTEKGMRQWFVNAGFMNIERVKSERYDHETTFSRITHGEGFIQIYAEKTKDTQVKPKLYFVPIYIAALRYYERLIPDLAKSYDIGFLLTTSNDIAMRQMVRYCEDKQYAFYALSAVPQRERGVRMPFFSPIQKLFKRRKECREFIENVRPAKLIFSHVTSYYSTLANEANKFGIETIVLQWSVSSSVKKIFNTERQLSFPLIKRIYWNFLHTPFATIRKLKKGTEFGINVRGVITPQKLGVIDKNARESIVRQFNPPPTIVRVVGSIDVQDVRELKERLLRDGALKEELEKKYGVNDEKLNILVFSTLFFSIKYGHDEYNNYFGNIFKDIRNVFPPEKARIIFKTHPREDARDLQKLCEMFSVVACGGDSRADELACISDLCVSDPWTTANYYILGSNGPAIFVNFSDFQNLNVSAKDYHIKNVITDRKQFTEALQGFKEHKLEKQYDNSVTEFHARGRIIQFIDE